MKTLKNSIKWSKRGTKFFVKIFRGGYQMSCIHKDGYCDSRCPAFNTYEADDGITEVLLLCVNQPLVLRFDKDDIENFSQTEDTEKGE